MSTLEVSMTTFTRKAVMFAPLAVVLILASSGAADAQWRHDRFGVRIGPVWGYARGPYYGAYYRPYWGPYPFAYYPYVVDRPTSAVRVKDAPKQAEMFIDGYYAGTVGKVRTTPGGHMITLYLPGYRTVTEDVYVAPGSTVTIQERMEKLSAGEASLPPPPPARRARPGTPPPTGLPDEH